MIPLIYRKLIFFKIIAELYCSYYSEWTSFISHDFNNKMERKNSSKTSWSVISALSIYHMQAWHAYLQDITSTIYKLIQLQHEQVATSELLWIKLAVLGGVMFQELESLQHDGVRELGRGSKGTQRYLSFFHHHAMIDGRWTGPEWHKPILLLPATPL